MSLLKKLSVAAKIYTVSLTGFGAAMALAAGWYVKEGRVDAAGASHMAQQDLARNAQVTFKEQVQAWKNILIRGSNPEKFEKYGKEFFEKEATTDSLTKALLAQATDAEVVSLSKEFLKSHEELGKAYRDALTELGKSGGTAVAEADKALNGKDRAPVVVLDSVVMAVKRDQHQFGEESLRLRLVIVVSVTVALLVMIPIVIMIVRSGITQPIQRVGEVVAQASQGDLRARIGAKSQDEIGQLSQAFDTFLDKVSEAVRGIGRATSTVSIASRELASVSDSLSSSAQTQASSLEETAASMEELTSTVKHNADNAVQANSLATSAREVANKGGTVVGEAVGAMGEINTSSKKIAEIITTIDEIAFQTNLLALNAAVEAARAGAQGRGFAVVAAEVRSLAARSASAAKEIKGLIQESSQKVDQGTTLVNHSGSSLEEIVSSVKRVTDIVGEIAAASKQQSVGIEEVNRAVTQMDQLTQQNAAQTEELSATAGTLAQQAVELESLVAWFRIEEGHVSAAAPVVKAASKPMARRKAGKTPAREVTVHAGSDDGFVDF